MIYANIVLTVKDSSSVEEVAELLKEQGRLSREEPGCERFEVYHSRVDSDVFILVERWESQAALDAHREAYAYQNVYQPRVIPLVDRVGHVSELIG